jgi:CubicO group peptidase (beta-lactamase class C family)
MFVADDGIAVREGKLGPDEGVPPLLPEYVDLLGGSSFKNGILVDHLLSMRSGLSWGEEDAGGASLPGLRRSGDDWLRYIFCSTT